MTTALKHLDEMRTKARKGGGDSRIQKQHDKGKLTARERLDILLDKGSFTELDMFVQHRAIDFGLEKNRISNTNLWHGAVQTCPIL
jgi:propionyl-CoA carboxylase beta chain